MKIRKISKKLLLNQAKSLRSKRLITISATIEGEECNLFYQFHQNDQLFMLKLTFPKEEHHVPSIIKIFPNANIYEREIHDLFGIEFEGNPNLDHHLFLSDKWDAGPPRRDDKNA